MEFVILEDVLLCRLENRYKGSTGVFCLNFLGAVTDYFSIMYSITSLKTSMFRPYIYYDKN
jgi:hypothetical protein